MEISMHLLTTIMECYFLAAAKLVIHAKEVAQIADVAERTARKILHQIRVKLNKTKDMFVTIEEFCAHKGLNADEVRRQLRG